MQGQVADEKQPPSSSGQNVQLVHWWVLLHWLQQGIDKENSATEAVQAMGGAGRNPGRASVGVGCLPPMQRMISNLGTLQKCKGTFAKTKVPYIFVKSLKLKTILTGDKWSHLVEDDA
jgi:hypothetical protein